MFAGIAALVETPTSSNSSALKGGGGFPSAARRGSSLPAVEVIPRDFVLEGAEVEIARISVVDAVRVHRQHVHLVHDARDRLLVKREPLLLVGIAVGILDERLQ